MFLNIHVTCCQGIGNFLAGMAIPIDMIGRVAPVFQLSQNRLLYLVFIISDIDNVLSPLPSLLPGPDIHRGNAEKAALTDAATGITDNAL